MSFRFWNSCSEIAVTSAPVSSLNVMTLFPKLRKIRHDDSWLASVTVSKKVVSRLSSCVEAVVAVFFQHCAA